MQPTKEKSSTTPISAPRAPAMSSRLSSNPNLVANQIPPDNSSFAPLGPTTPRTNPAVMSQPSQTSSISVPNSRLSPEGTMPVHSPEALKPGIQNLLPPDPPGPSAGSSVAPPSALPLTTPPLPNTQQSSGIVEPATLNKK